MDNQGWKTSAIGNEQDDVFSVQTTYVPPQPTYGDSFDYQVSAVTKDEDGVVPSVPTDNMVEVELKGDSVISFHESDLKPEDMQGNLNSRSGASMDAKQESTTFSAAQKLLGGFLNSSSDPDIEDQSGQKKSSSMFSLQHYCQYFDVDTMDVLSRMLDSVIGFVRPNFFEKTKDNVDLYGPFWIATTLIFVSAVTGNYAGYLSYKHHEHEDATDAWYYNVDKVGFSAILLYGYVGVIGFLLYAVLKFGFKSSFGLVQAWCVYGYSLSIFIPISFFCIFPNETLRWLLISVATMTSGMFLLFNTKQPIFESGHSKAWPLWIALGCLHVGLGLALKLYFFRYSNPN